ncbi:hypothetical protein GIB67_014916 [Kingdonia uniflora]|uniref:Uncharacterized protein n=1 Tax=Kingdonia uniflora TaxID=39325 RepID=A0A7J7MTI7_9MAGN|nr:hypothetical protein GIB67_014916 [Kingdonia uniflora]
MLLQGLQNRTSAQSQTPEVQEKNIPIEEERNLTQTPNEEVKRKEELDVDDHWLKEEDVETAGTSFHSQNRLGDEEDVSFSDLEDDDDNETSSKQGESSLATNVAVSSPNGSSGWVQLSENSDNGEARKQVRRTSREKYSEGEESNDWLTINDSDSDSPGTA